MGTDPFRTQWPAIVAACLLMACGGGTEQPVQAQTVVAGQPQYPAGAGVAHFAEGCFWCAEEIFEHVRGVHEVINGYSGGDVPNPTYELVNTGTTGHAEAVEVYYDPSVVDFATLVKIFFASQDPTTPSRQGPDVGPQYRSIAFYDTPEQEAIIRAHIRELEASGRHDRPIVVEVKPFVKFWPAEGYHQDYAGRNPGNPYIQRVSMPRLERFKETMPEVLK
jgi:peptide-methionine (S)-S-oxide reductase